MRLRPGTPASTPDESLPDPSALHNDVRRLFLVIVVYLNLGILAVSVGVMLAAFRGEYLRAGLLVGAGLVVLGLAVRRYRSRHAVFAAAD